MYKVVSRLKTTNYHFFITSPTFPRLPARGVFGFFCTLFQFSNIPTLFFLFSGLSFDVKGELVDPTFCGAGTG